MLARAAYHSLFDFAESTSFPGNDACHWLLNCRGLAVLCRVPSSDPVWAPHLGRGFVPPPAAQPGVPDASARRVPRMGSGVLLRKQLCRKHPGAAFLPADLDSV